MCTISRRKLRRKMTLQEFKNELKGQKCAPKCYIFVCQEDHLLANMYIQHYANMMKYDIEYVESLEDLVGFASYSFGNDSNIVYVIHVDKIEDELPKKLLNFNCIIVCDTIVNKGQFELIEIPKLSSWQLEDYARVKLKGLNQKKIDWLVELLKNNAYRLDQEIKKISIFREDERDYIFDLMNNDGAFDDITNLTIFSLINAISKKNKKDIIGVLEVLKLIDIDPIGLNTLLLKQFRSVIDVKMGTLTAKELGMSDKQFNAIRRYNPYTPNELVHIIDILTGLDYKVKSGELPIDFVIDYLICNIVK